MSAKRVWLPLLLIAASTNVHATTPKNKPTFRLTLSITKHLGGTPASKQGLLLKYTNISAQDTFEQSCSAFGEIYRLIVKLNGVELDESEVAKQQRISAQTGQCDLTSGLQRFVAPGKSIEHIIYYDAKAVGTYKFTVEADSGFGDPPNNIKVRSNTVRIVFPDPQAESTK